jgi:alpha-mannosidase
MRSKICLLCIGLIALCGLAAPAAGPDGASTNDVYVIPFSHLDLMWAGTLEECLSRGGRITTKAIEIANRHPEFRFLLEDGVFAADYVDAHRGAPEVAELKRLVKEGRIEIGAEWVGIYQNLPRGEALVRNLVYGKQYAREVFQVDPQAAVLTDVPGFTEQLPQILVKSGTPCMVMTRMGPPDCSLFRYRSPDGSAALVWSTIKGYGWGIGLGLHRDALNETNFARIAQSVGQVQATTTGPIYLGWGTDLFAPSENLVSNVALLNQRLAPMQFRLATPAEYFRAASKVEGIPEISGEVPSSWGNILTSLVQLWPPAMKAADTLLTAEKFAAINFALGYADYPQKEFESLWKCALAAMDHNNFGQGGYIGDERKLEYAATATMRGGQIIRDSLRNIAERVQRPFARCTPIVVFNPMNWERDDVISTHVSLYGDVPPGDIRDYLHAMRLVDEKGVSVPFYVEQSYGTVSRAFEIVFVARGVPSLGYKTYFIVPAENREEFPNACELKLDEPDPARPKRVLGADQVENGFYRVTVDRATGRITVFDKELDRPVVKDMEIVGYENRGGNSIAVEPVTGRQPVNMVNDVKIEENNPARTVVRIDGDLGGVAVTQRLFLYGGLKRVDLENTVDWKQGRLMKIEQVFPYEHPDAQIRYGIPYGSAAGSDIMPKSGPRGSDELPRSQWEKWRQIQDWIFAGTPEWGLTISADRQLMILDDGMIRSGMLRGTYSTTVFTRDGKQVLIPVPPAAKYVCHYSLTSGKGDWMAAKSYRTGMAFSAPLIPVSAVDELSAKSLPSTHSFCSLEAGNLVVTALKKADHDNAVVLRVVEMDGSKAETPVEFLGHDSSFSPVNLLEESPRGAVEQQTLKLKPYEISTVRLIAK